MVSAGYVIFHSDHLMNLIIMNLLVSGLYNLYAYLLWLSDYPTMMDLYVFSFLFFLIFHLSMTYKIRPKSEKEPIIWGFYL